MIRDNRGISVMHDAVLFAIMISISGAIMLPALITDVPGEIYRDKKMDETAQDILIELMNCRVDEFQHKNLGDIFDNNNELLEKVTDVLLKREQLHRTYADIVSECLSSQIKFNGKQYNILTTDYTNKVKKLLEDFINKRTGLAYNLTVVWRPIEGVNFGGKICVGKEAPDENIYVASTYFSMPPSFIVDTMGDPITEIENKLLNLINKGEINKDELHEQIKQIIDSALSEFIESVFASIEEKIMGGSSEMVDELLDKLHMSNLESKIKSELGISYDKIIYEVKNDVNNYLDNDLFPLMDKIIDSSTDVINEIMNFLLKYIDFYRAKATLIMWEV